MYIKEDIYYTFKMVYIILIHVFILSIGYLKGKNAPIFQLPQ